MTSITKQIMAKAGTDKWDQKCRDIVRDLVLEDLNRAFEIKQELKEILAESKKRQKLAEERNAKSEKLSREIRLIENRTKQMQRNLMWIIFKDKICAVILKLTGRKT